MPCQQGLEEINCRRGGIQTLVSFQSITRLLILKTNRLQEVPVRPCTETVRLPTGHNSVSSSSFLGKELQLRYHKDSV